jgi:iron-sulfur cluster repair protein YtfE (RIC family)
MCHYCGCRQIPLIRDYIAEHERATDLAGDTVRAIEHGDLETAQRSMTRMSAELTSHWQGEENGLFRIMRREQDYAEYIANLVLEHRQLADLLAAVDIADPRDQEKLRTAMAELLEHISKEEDGLFPASLTALTGRDWDAAFAAWSRAHPGEHLISD